MIHELCADTRRIAGEMKKVPRAVFTGELDAKFYSSCPDSANNFWEGKKPSLRQGKSAEAFLRKECMTLPLSTNPVWKDLFPNAPEHATAWMKNYSDGQCGGAYIHQGFLHTATTYLGRHSRFLYDFSRMDHPPAMTPYDLWWNGEEMRVHGFLFETGTCCGTGIEDLSPFAFPLPGAARIITEPSLACCSVRTWAQRPDSASSERRIHGR